MGLAAVSLALKQTTVFLWLALFVGLWGVRKGFLRMLVPASLWCLSFAPYLPDGLNRIVERVILYNSWSGSYGLQLILPKSTNSILFFAVMVGLPVLLRKRSTESILFAETAAFFVFAHGMGMNLFTVAIVLSAALAPAWCILFTAASLPTLWLPGFLVVGQAGMNTVWLVSVGAWARSLTWKR